MVNQSEADLNRCLLSTTDALVWAEEFVRIHGGDEGLMISWFANAIEVGRSAGQRLQDYGR